jgi:hypothetical protein
MGTHMLVGQSGCLLKSKTRISVVSSRDVSERRYANATEPRRLITLAMARMFLGARWRSGGAVRRNLFAFLSRSAIRKRVFSTSTDFKRRNDLISIQGTVTTWRRLFGWMLRMTAGAGTTKTTRAIGETRIGDSHRGAIWLRSRSTPAGEHTSSVFRVINDVPHRRFSG